MKESVLVLCAHSDDQIFGAGGTIAKYAAEGIEVTIIIMTYGEKSHPWLKKHEIAKRRVGESMNAARIVGAKDTLFFNLDEGKFEKDFKRHKVEKRLTKIIQELNPSKIISHSQSDPHPDHKVTANFIKKLCKKIKYQGDLYCFDVWTPVKIKDRDSPSMYVDISPYFKKKISALKCFMSQKMTMLLLLWSVYYKAVKYGMKNKCRYAESFHKVDFNE